MANLLETLKQIVNAHEPLEDEHALPRAAAVLLIEMAVADDSGDEDELRVVESAVRDQFDLADEELDELIAEATRQQHHSVSMHDFTRQLRTHLAPEARAELIGWLWRVAWADGRVDRYEEHLLRRLADLLGVSHQEFIRRKLMEAPEG